MNSSKDSPQDISSLSEEAENAIAAGDAAADVGVESIIARDSEVITRVKTWMRKQGVGLEMSVAGEFRKQLPSGRFMSSVQHSRTYTGFDESSGVSKIRETDVVVRLTKLIMNNLWITTWIIVECKTSKDATWVLHHDSANPSIFSSVPFGGLWQLKHHESVRPENVLGSTESGLLSGNGIGTCYSVSATRDPDARGNQKNDARDAILQVLSAAKGVQESAELTDGYAQLHIFIPVVVTNAPLVNVTLLLNGECTYTETQSGLFLGQLSPNSDKPDGVWLINDSYLEEFVNEILTKIHALDYRMF